MCIVRMLEDIFSLGAAQISIMSSTVVVIDSTKVNVLFLNVPGILPHEASTQSKYRMGYLECINEVGRFLGSLEIDEVELRTKIIDHLANCVAGARLEQSETEVPSSVGYSHSPAVIRPRPEKPGISLISRSDVCSLPVSVSDLSSSINSNIAQSVKPSSQEELRTPTSCQSMSVINLFSTPSICSPNVQIGHITSSNPNDIANVTQNVSPEPQKQKRDFSNLPKPDTGIFQAKSVLLNQPDLNIKVVGTHSATQASSFTSAQIFGGLQLVPTQLPSGDIAFILPANIIPTTQTPSYVIPVLSPNTLTPLSNPPSEQVTSSVSSVIPTVGFKPMSVSTVTPAVTGHIVKSNYVVTPAKSTFPARIESSPVHQTVCDSRRDGTINPQPNDKSSANQSAISSTEVRSCLPEHFISVRNIPTSTHNFLADEHKPRSDLFFSSNHGTSVPSVGTEQTPPQNQAVSNQLVLNLTMQNRTRAGQEMARRNFQEEDESMWRPW